MRKVDIFNHFFPAAYFQRMQQVAGGHKDIGKRVRGVPCIHDLEERFRVLDQFDDYVQVLSLPAPPIEALAGPDVACEMARIGNDGLADLVDRFPDRFPAFIASVALSDPDAAVREAERAVTELGAGGVQIYTHVNQEPLDRPEFEPFFAKMAELDRAVWIHPARGADHPDYLSENRSKYEIWWTFGWPYETSVALARLVFSGVIDRNPGLKLLAHHLGAMVPFFEGRVGPGWDQLGARTSDEDLGAVLKTLKRRPLDYFKTMYADTAVFGSKAATICGLSFYGPDRVLFASDCPFDPEKGPGYIRSTIEILDQLDIDDETRGKIYRGNAEKLLKKSFA